MKANVKTIVLANKRAVRPETWEEISKAENGQVVWVEPTEMNAFVCLNIFLPEDAPMPIPRKRKEPKSAEVPENSGGDRGEAVRR